MELEDETERELWAVPESKSAQEHIAEAREILAATRRHPAGYQKQRKAS